MLTLVYALYCVNCAPVTGQARFTRTANLKLIRCAQLGILNCIAKIDSIFHLGERGKTSSSISEKSSSSCETSSTSNNYLIRTLSQCSIDILETKQETKKPQARLGLPQSDIGHHSVPQRAAADRR